MQAPIASERESRVLISTRLQPGVTGTNKRPAVSTASSKRMKAAEAADESPCVSDTRLKPGANENCADFLLWQLADSAFPTGGFAHSGGLEGAAQNGEIRNRVDLREWLSASLRQVSRAALPLANAAHEAPDRLSEIDELCDAFTSNHVANRASRLQGRALLMAAERIFAVNFEPDVVPACAHLAPVFGGVMRLLDVEGDMMRRLFVFQYLRGIIASAVRLNLVGPMEGQVIQRELSADAETVAESAAGFGLDELAQTSPLLDLWQGTQDRLYSRLFQS